MEEPKPKRNWFVRHKVWSVILMLIVLAIIGSAMGGNKKNQNAQNTSAPASPQSKSEPKSIGLNQPAADGKFEFTVSSIECSKASVGSNQYLTKTAQGEFCLLNLTVKNVGNEKQTLFSANQVLFDDQNRKLSADDTATIYASPNNQTWLQDINPGNSVTGAIVFDVPKGDKIVSAELHDSAFSGGVKVSLK